MDGFRLEKKVYPDGTFIGLAKLLRQRNVGKLYLAVSHITVENPNKELGSLYDRVFTTNSKELEYPTINNLTKLNMQ